MLGSVVPTKNGTKLTYKLSKLNSIYNTSSPIFKDLLDTLTKNP
jgi:hypothetical protein